MKGNAKILLAAAQTLVAGAAFCGGFAGYEDAEDMPGAVSMIWTGREMLVETSGYADIAAKRPISTNDVFWVASNTKAISCALMLRLVDRGLVGLDRPVADYIPEWKGIRLKDGKAPSHAPTVRETMGHTAGLAFFPKMPITQYSVQELARMAAKDGLDHDVGEYLYSNWGIDVAMAVVERVTGKPWEEMLETEVLQPLGMADTVFFPSAEVVKTRLAKAYRLDPYHDGVAPKEETIDQLVYPYNTAGSHAEAGGGLFSTAPDLMGFFRMVAAKGVLPDGRRFISEGLMREWYGLTDYFRNRKYSFGMDIDPEHRFVRHGGAYGTDGAANWERGTARVFMTQVAMWTARTMSRRRNWEDYAAQWLGVGADRVLRLDAAAFGASPSASAETNAKAIQQAIDDCASTGGEGVVTLPKGTVKTLPYVLKPRVRLACEEESRLEVVTNPANEVVGRERIVYVSAHPDDLGGSLGTMLRLSETYEIHLVTFTHGERGLGERGYRDGTTRKTRTAEEESVARAAGFTLHWCEEIDGEAYAGREACARLAEIFRALKPRAVIVHWPVDIHRDHMMSTAAAIKAVDLAGLAPEIYFQEQDIQSRLFPGTYYVDVTELTDRRRELISLWRCQNGPKMAERKIATSKTNALRIWGDASRRAEVFGVFPGTVAPGKGIFDTMERVSR